MTNKQLAHNLEATIPFLMKEVRHQTDADDILREAAKRLRNVTIRSDNSAVIAELERRLKVAEEFTTWVALHAENELWQTIRDKAIETEFNMRHPECAELREEGGEK